MRALLTNMLTFMPAGIANATPGARQRWKAHKWRYPSYQYRTEFMMTHKRTSRKLRPLNADGRECLRFLCNGSTVHALNPVPAKNEPQQLEDVRCSLIGNTFHGGWSRYWLRH